MKRIIGLFVICLLGACSSPQNCKQRPIPPGDQALYTQKMETVPWPWVQIIPSERAAVHEGINFSSIDQLIRLGMVSAPKRFEKITLVLVDYTILPARKEIIPPPSRTNLRFSEKYIPIPKLFFLKIRFYECEQRPPAEPLYVGTAVIPSHRICFQETLRYLTDTLMFELGQTTSNRIFLELDSRNPHVAKEKSHKKGHHHSSTHNPAPAPAQEPTNSSPAHHEV